MKDDPSPNECPPSSLSLNALQQGETANKGELRIILSFIQDRQADSGDVSDSGAAGFPVTMLARRDFHQK